eukprot:scaffold1221_cov237-Pinguiococcus_pyrenoidosus.AAC.4
MRYDGQYVRELFDIFDKLEEALLASGDRMQASPAPGQDAKVVNPNLNAMAQFMAAADEAAFGLRTRLDKLCQILRFIVLLNYHPLVELLLRNDVFPRVAAVFEYDGKLKQKAEYRRFLAEQARMKEVVPLQDPELRNKITQTFRAKFLKESMIRPLIDETGVGAVNGVIVVNSSEIAEYFRGNMQILGDIVVILKPPVFPEKHAQVRDALRLLLELLQLSKSMYPLSRVKLLQNLFEDLPLMGYLGALLADPSPVAHLGPGENTGPEALQQQSLDKQLRLLASELLFIATMFHPPLIFQNAMKSSPPPPLPGVEGNPFVEGEGGPAGPSELLSPKHITRYLEQHSSNRDDKDDRSSELPSALFGLSRCLDTSADEGVLVQCFEALRLALDTESIDVTEQEGYVRLLYEHYMQWLLLPLIRIDTQSTSGSLHQRWRPLYYSLQLLATCVHHHTHRIRYLIHRMPLMNGATSVLRSCPDGAVKLAGLKFLKACVETRDAALSRALIQAGALQAAVEILDNSFKRGRDGLLTSAVADLIDYILRENARSLITHLVEKGQDVLKGWARRGIPAFESIIQRYRQMSSVEDRTGWTSAGSGSGSNAGSVLSRDGLSGKSRILQDDEDEEYLNDSDDDFGFVPVASVREEAGQSDEGSDSASETGSTSERESDASVSDISTVAVSSGDESSASSKYSLGSSSEEEGGENDSDVSDDSMSESQYRKPSGQSHVKIADQRRLGSVRLGLLQRHAPPSPPGLGFGPGGVNRLRPRNMCLPPAMAPPNSSLASASSSPASASSQAEAGSMAAPGALVDGHETDQDDDDFKTHLPRVRYRNREEDEGFVGKKFKAFGRRRKHQTQSASGLAPSPSQKGAARVHSFTIGSGHRKSSKKRKKT